MERIVKIRMNGGKVIEKIVSAVTFGELKQEVGMDFANLKVIIRETRHTLEDNAAQLPLQDFNLFVYPLKVKSGVDYKSLGYQGLRRLCKERGIEQKATNGMLNGNYGDVTEMVKKLEAADKKANKASAKQTPTENCEDCKPVVKETKTTSSVGTSKEEVIDAIQTIQNKLDELKELVYNMQEVTIANEVDTLAEEFEEVRKILLPFGVR